ncbi:MAG TPA: sodium-dependent transporter [Myxococcales bacterium LLY-WYZ-16_1]|jgi:neurotransmitter:Na+ symporter, NSS family|nr:sodium-dependent transporter [Myxococcales bacterium LLY-WYZ-16_1]
MSNRDHWGSRFGFILAATGSAVGLGNIWKFPYITGTYGGGLFVLVYLVCIALVGVPVLIAEVIIGRAAQQSPVDAFEKLAHEGGNSRSWGSIGWLGVVAGFVILSFYSVVAGWAMHYTFLAGVNTFAGMDANSIAELFGSVFANGPLNIFWHTVVMGVTVSIVVGGVSGGIETAVRFLMPALLVLMAGLFIDGMLQPGFSEAVSFVFAPRGESMNAEGFLEALGHGFFTLSLGMGAMLTYGSYLQHDDDVPGACFAIAIMDTFVALAACMIIFPVIFTFGLDVSKGPGLVFVTIPVALRQLTGGPFLNFVFFALLFFAALSSAISLLEVVTSSAIDRLGWTRKKATLWVGVAIYLVGIPSALTGSTDVFGASFEAIFGKSFFDSFDWLSSSVLLPLGGFFVAIYTGWVMPEDRRRAEFARGSKLGNQYPIWLFFIRWVSPVAILIVFLFTVEILPRSWLHGS